ncbi:MAG: CBS domain-containing protein [Theionarchaea archaeon]|nr:CBS domain-containing protein [Theionarchaea archaeon]
MQVQDIMSPPTRVKPDEFATRIRALLRETDRIITVEEKNRFLGIITRQDAMLLSSTKSNLKARDIMSQPLITGAREDDVYHIGRQMIEKDVSFILIMEDTHCVGVVHADDVLQAVHHDVSEKVSEIMTEEVVSCDHTADITKIWNLMGFHNFTGIPVVEEVTTSSRKYKKMVGFLTRKDVLKTGEVRPGVDRQRFTNPPPVSKVMNRTPVYIRSHESVNACVDLFITHRIGRIPVVKNGFELVGIVDREDMLKLYV